MNRVLLIFIVIVTGCTSLTQQDSDLMVARVGNAGLYESDLALYIPEGLSSSDSLTIAQRYIDKWVKEQVIIQKAIQNLTEEESDFTKQLQEYRNSLTIYAYESKLVKQNLDTVVNMHSIEAYYNENKNNFTLKENIVKMNYVQVHMDSSGVEDFRKLIRADNPDQMGELEEHCKHQATHYWLEDDWLYFSEVLDLAPIEVDDQERFLRRNRFFELKLEPYLFLVNIQDYKLRDSLAPLSFEENNIRNIILNKRKQELIKKTREGLFESAVNNNEVEVFN